ncbi:MAG: AAA family ATPase [Solidesulfovibrio sp. DCME]|uniref:AAA family ATPase n=1 Tax=Solidesulfovibrio sp. DCME TaxID=3447380 RepID=UPI003D0F8EA4
MILTDFMAHARTTLDLSPGLTVLTGPNNTGKSAVVEALRCLAENPVPRHVIRHGAAEARVTAELDDGTVVTWVRRPKYALYELTRPGADAPETFAKFGRTPPEEITRILGLASVPIEGGLPVDVHIGNQREPVFLLDKPGSALSGFFAAATEAAHLIAMQNLLTDRIRKATTEKKRQEKRLAELGRTLDRLAPLPELDLRLERAAAMEADLEAADRRLAALAGHLAEAAAGRRRREALLRAGQALAGLAAPPRLADTAPLAASLAQGGSLARRRAVAGARQAALAPLAAPPGLADTASLGRRAADIRRLAGAKAVAGARRLALAALAAPPQPADTDRLALAADRLAAARAATGRLAARSAALAPLAAPPPLPDTLPLAGLLAAMSAAREAVDTAAAGLARRGEALAALSARIAARLGELGSCPLCGGALSAEAFLGGAHGHGAGDGGRP